MKALLVIVALAAAAFAAYQFYLKDHPFAWMQTLQTTSTLARGTPGAGATPVAPQAKKDFRDVSAELQADMDHVPLNLHAPRQMPTRALDVKTKVAPYLQMHGEYQTLSEVCDLIISADQDFSERQGKCGLGTIGPGATAQERARAANPNLSVYQQQEAIWEGRRRQTDADVRLKLGSLENHRL